MRYSLIVISGWNNSNNNNVLINGLVLMTISVPQHSMGHIAPKTHLKAYIWRTVRILWNTYLYKVSCWYKCELFPVDPCRHLFMNGFILTVSFQPQTNGTAQVNTFSVRVNNINTNKTMSCRAQTLLTAEWYNLLYLTAYIKCCLLIGR